LYSQANRPRVKEENPESAFGEIVSLQRAVVVLLIAACGMRCSTDLCKWKKVASTRRGAVCCRGGGVND
jgi:hypothetical protein